MAKAIQFAVPVCRPSDPIGNGYRMEVHYFIVGQTTFDINNIATSGERSFELTLTGNEAAIDIKKMISRGVRDSALADFGCVLSAQDIVLTSFDNAAF